MKYLNDFLKHLINLNYSTKTLKDYSYIISDFDKYLNAINIFDEKNVTESHFTDYISKYKNSEFHSSYYKSVTIIKKYFRFLQEFNYIFLSPIEKIKNPKQVVKHHPLIDKKELFKILNNLDSDDPFVLRTRAIFELMYSSALRPGECLNLNINSINYLNKTILIRKTKTKTDRFVPVTSEALYRITKYIEKVRFKNNRLKDNNKLFISFNSDNAITVKGLNNSLKFYFTKKKLPRFSLYSIRATSATHLFENGMSISYLALLLGHKDYRATAIYVRVSFILLKKMFDQHHPRNKLEDKRIKNYESTKVN